LRPNYSKLRRFGIGDVIVIDTEYVAKAGEQVIPVCVCARSLFTGKLWREFYRSGLASTFPTDPETVYVAYAAQAEWSFFLAAGWPLPCSIIDLFAERALETNGLKDAAGKRIPLSLLASLDAYGIDSMTAIEKESMRDLILRGAPYSAKEKESILAYCMDDVTNTGKLFHAMLPGLDVMAALFRGGYSRAVAHVEFSGVPIDITAVRRLKSNWPETMVKLATQLEDDHSYGCYVIERGRAKWDTLGFASLIDRMNLWEEWPKTDTGKLVVADGHGKDGRVFKQMAELHPELEDLRVMRNTFSELKTFDLPIGADGRCRTPVFPYWTSTGRNQPKRGFIFSLPKWTRFLIKPGPGRALAYLDLESAEFGIAAALSGDRAMMSTYAGAEDNYLATAKLAGAVPVDATKRSHPRERKHYKIATLGLQYGMTEWGLALQLGISCAEAKRILDDLSRVYHSYFDWIIDVVAAAQAFGRIAAPMGWALHVTEETNPRSLFNFPMQATCAEILRIAADLMVKRGLQVCAMIHDAVLIEGAVQNIDRDCEIANGCWTEASVDVLDGFALKSDCVITRYPKRFVDEDGQKMWNRLRELKAA
jgi:DNA polymerase-1